MFWKNKELEELKGSVSRLASAIVEKEIYIQDVHKKVYDLEKGLKEINNFFDMQAETMLILRNNFETSLQDLHKSWDARMMTIEALTETLKKKLDLIYDDYSIPSKDILNIQYSLQEKFKSLETMCLTTISQLQNVSLAHAERLKKLEAFQEYDYPAEIKIIKQAMSDQFKGVHERLKALEHNQEQQKADYRCLKQATHDRLCDVEDITLTKEVWTVNPDIDQLLEEKLEKPKELKKK